VTSDGDAAPGELALVLHTHLPELRHHGVWPVGEEWLFEAWGTSWLPVTALLESKIISRRVVAFPEQDMEALHLLEVRDFPCIVAVAHGKCIY